MKGVVIILGYIFLGIILIQLISPLLDGLTALLLTIIESIKGYFNVKISKYNAEVAKNAKLNEDSPRQTSILGFTIPEEDEYVEEEEEEDDL